MKKIFLSLLILFFQLSIANAMEEITLDKSLIEQTELLTNEKLAVVEDNNFDSTQIDYSKYDILNNYNVTNPETQGQMRFFNGVSQLAKDTYHLQVEDTSKPAYLFKEPLTHHFERGPLESIYTHSVVIMNNSEAMQEHGVSNDSFNVSLINTIVGGKFRNEKEDFQLLFDTTPTHTHKFFSLFFQDIFIRTYRIPHHTILIGNSRPAVGMEGSQSAFTIPFIARSQIARNFGTVRKFGARIMGNYSLVDYDLGGFSSDTYFSNPFCGTEFNGRVNFKPLGKTDGRWGKAMLGGGIVSGEKHAKDFFVATAHVGYEYKRAWMLAEYANADGSNGGDGFTTKKRSGWCVTLGYKLTKKLELIARYDEFNPDKTITHNNKKEYSAGINYYIKGQALRFILNYVFCQNQNAKDSHRLVIGAQIGI